MLETYSSGHQGMGLHGQPAALTGLRVLAMVHSASGPASTAAEHAVLWPVCAHLQRLGHRVLVLDASQAETPLSPGLAQLLLQNAWHAQSGLCKPQAQDSVATLPAHLGLDLLAAQAQTAASSALDWLHRYVRGYSLVLVYASAPSLCQVLQGHAVQPLLVLEPRQISVLGSYRQLKQLALHAGLSCVLAPLDKSELPPEVPRYDWSRGQSNALSDAQDAQQRQSHIEALLACAQRYLGRRPALLPTRSGHAPHLQRLALHLLNHACTIQGGGSHTLPSAPTRLPASTVWSH